MLSEEESCLVMEELVEAFTEMNEKNLMHRDIKFVNEKVEIDNKPVYFSFFKIDIQRRTKKRKLKTENKIIKAIIGIWLLMAVVRSSKMRYACLCEMIMPKTCPMRSII